VGRPIALRLYRRGPEAFTVAVDREPGDAPGMCLGIPAQIVELVDVEAAIAKADVAGVRRDVSVALCPEAEVGDWVLVHVGFALSRIDETQALETLSLLEQLGPQYEQELDELKAGTV
jgi:hydrogenase expression/formation protein HypC